MIFGCNRLICQQQQSFRQSILKGLSNTSILAKPVLGIRTMSTSLNEEKCEPCKRTTPLLPKEEYDTLYAQLNEGWQIKPFVGSDQIKVLQKSFQFKNFKYALQFTNQVGQLAEEQKHHPEIILGWGHVEIAWWSHAIGGLHKNDFVCAAKTDQIANEAEGMKK